MTDLNVTADWWWRSDHQNAELESDGSNLLRNDGSTVWRNTDELRPRFDHAGQIFFF